MKNLSMKSVFRNGVETNKAVVLQLSWFPLAILKGWVIQASLMSIGYWVFFSIINAVFCKFFFFFYSANYFDGILSCQKCSLIEPSKSLLSTPCILKRGVQKLMISSLNSRQLIIIQYDWCCYGRKRSRILFVYIYLKIKMLEE